MTASENVESNCGTSGLSESNAIASSTQNLPTSYIECNTDSFQWVGIAICPIFQQI